MNHKWQKRVNERYGPWALVTGASSGIGQEIVFKLAEAGLNLVLVARRQEVLEQMCGDLKARYGIEVKVIGLDLGLETSSKTVADLTRELDIGLLVASAGFGISGSFLHSPLADHLNLLTVNCRALLELSWIFGRRFAQRGRGGMVLMSSIVGFQGMPFNAHYAATKAYVQALAEALYVELAPFGIDVLAAAPGPTDSGFAQRAGMKMGAALRPQDIAQPILEALGRGSTVLPGGLSKLLAYSLAPLPRWIRVRIMGVVMASMIKPQPTTFENLVEGDEG